MAMTFRLRRRSCVRMTLRLASTLSALPVVATFGMSRATVLLARVRHQGGGRGAAGDVAVDAAHLRVEKSQVDYDRHRENK